MLAIGFILCFISGIMTGAALVRDYHTARIQSGERPVIEGGRIVWKDEDDD